MDQSGDASKNRRRLPRWALVAAILIVILAVVNLAFFGFLRYRYRKVIGFWQMAVLSSAICAYHGKYQALPDELATIEGQSMYGAAPFTFRRACGSDGGRHRGRSLSICP